MTGFCAPFPASYTLNPKSPRNTELSNPNDLPRPWLLFLGEESVIDNQPRIPLLLCAIFPALLMILVLDITSHACHMSKHCGNFLYTQKQSIIAMTMHTIWISLQPPLYNCTSTFASAITKKWFIFYHFLTRTWYPLFQKHVFTVSSALPGVCYFGNNIAHCRSDKESTWNFLFKKCSTSSRWKTYTYFFRFQEPLF